ncbi:MAG: NAD(P)-dependent glycerol-3-phosphate dehydrogenase [Bacteroidetes bacterium]|nr:NAD(P)-dependent glycerol-3-phosphate dehydrogenase [Bacteroidota bacterium]
MTSKNTSGRPIGVIGAGSFGTVVANILSQQSRVILYARTPEKASRLIKTRQSGQIKLHDNIEVTSELKVVAENCEVLFPIVPSQNFRQLMRAASRHLKPYHIVIHGTKGLDLKTDIKISKSYPLTREHVRTMSEVILEETNVVRVGCLAGPNLASEMAKNQPAASVVASHFDEVIEKGQHLLKNDRFLIYGSHDLIGIELCGILKNVIAIGAGALSGIGLGENAKALLISRGLVEMIHLGNVLGGNTQAFIGLAGVGDLIATCSSSSSRNFTVGHRLAKGETIQQIMDSMDEVAEGVNTIKIVKVLAENYKVRAPITETLYRIIEGKMSVDQANIYLMKFPFRADIDFL